MKHAFNDTFGDFRCIHCRNYVSADTTYSGVMNRNHCPYCLWSKHLDLYEAGDRLCACKGGMQPVGLAVKKARKKYGSENQGELMLIHLCSECGRVSLNRIAADDLADNIYEVFESWLAAGEPVRRAVMASGVEALGETDTDLVRARLFGWSSVPRPRRQMAASAAAANTRKAERVY